MNFSLVFLSLSLSVWAGLLNTIWQAAVLVAIILLSKISPLRWKITEQQFYRWGDLSSLLTLALLLYAYQNQLDGLPIFVVLKWLPVLFAPVLYSQLFSSQQQIPLGTLFYSFRRRNTVRAIRIDFILPYTGLVLLSSGAANVQDYRYFWLMCVLISGLLWVSRPRQSSKIAWLLLMSAAIGISYYGQQSLRQLQNFVEDKAVAWLSATDDFFNSQTSIGDIGELKLSDKIIFRVKAPRPLLLLQASYDRYLGQSWTVSQRGFQAETPAPPINPAQLQKIQILQAFNQREELLALPTGTVTIKGLEGAFLQYNRLGTVKISQPPAFAAYQVFYTDKKTDPPSVYDVQIPRQHAAWLKQFVHQLGLETRPPQAIANAITAHFHRHFRYSLYLGTQNNADAALQEFMFKRKAGHCEYFAVATVLLLRQAGIPARLANGYVVEEYDSSQQLYRVRQRHAHAWAIAYIDGAWQAVDSTPSQWLDMENAQQAWFEPVQDFFSNQWFVFTRWRMQPNQHQSTVWLIAALLLSGYIGWRIYSAKAQLSQKIPALMLVSDNTPCLGLDSEFYLIEQHLQNTTQARGKQESLQQWIKRLQNPELLSLLALHYQLRFDPQGLSMTRRQQLQLGVKSWLNTNQQGKKLKN